MNADTRRNLLTILALAILCFTAYSNSFHGAFQYDDSRLILFNFSLRDLLDWKPILQYEPFRPLTVISFALNYQIGGTDPFSYHFTNFIFPLSATILFYLFLRRMLPRSAYCFIAAALFCVHPLNTESVSYIASRSVLLCAIFYLSALLFFDAYLRTSKW